MRGNSSPYLPSSRRTSRASLPSTGWARLKARLRLALFFSRLWLFIACRRRMRPLAVTLKRFFVALFVFCLGTLRHGLLGDILVRREDHDHVAAVEKRRRLDLTEVLPVLGEPHEEVASALGMCLLAAPEHDRHLHLRARVQEAHDVPLLRLVVVVSDLRPHLDFLDV